MLLVLSLAPVAMYGQQFMESNNYITSIGWEINRGDSIMIGTGSKSDGDFAFIYRGGDDLNTDAGKSLVVVTKIMKAKDGAGNITDCYILVSNARLNKYRVGIEAALRSGEITPPEGYIVSEVDKSLNANWKNFIITSSGDTIAAGARIKVGTGSMPDGDFKFIRVSATSFLQYYSTTGYQGWSTKPMLCQEATRD